MPAAKASALLFVLLLSFLLSLAFAAGGDSGDYPVYIWPLPKNYTFGNQSLTVYPNLHLRSTCAGNKISGVLSEALDRYKAFIFEPWVPRAGAQRDYDISAVDVCIASDDETLQYRVDESYSLYIGADSGGNFSIITGVLIEANTVYGALRALETFSQLCIFNSETKTVEVHSAPWYIQDEPRFAFRGLLLDTSRHYLPVHVIKQVIDSMSHAKLNVLHWHIVDEQSFPLEVPSYPDLWKGSYTKWERYTVEEAIEVVKFAKHRGIHVMAEIDVPGHASSWGEGYPDLWPSADCREPLDVSNNFTFKVISGVLSDLRNIFPFGMFHLGGDEVNTDCWASTPHVKQWLQERNMTAKDAYRYFVLKAQDLAVDLNWIPVNWEETFTSFREKLNPRTVIHNWLRSGVCAEAVALGFRCIYSNQGVWYLDHLDVPWEKVYISDPLDGITDSAHQGLVMGGEVCMWSETADASVVLQTIWPRAAAAAERLWSPLEATSNSDLNATVLPRLHYFRCLLNGRGITAAPVSNFYGRRPPVGPGSCFEQ